MRFQFEDNESFHLEIIKDQIDIEIWCFRNKLGGIMKTLTFIDAYCVSYEEVYDDTNTDRMYESITITCRQLTVTGKGSVEYDNHWAL